MAATAEAADLTDKKSFTREEALVVDHEPVWARQVTIDGTVVPPAPHPRVTEEGEGGQP